MPEREARAASAGSVHSIPNRRDIIGHLTWQPGPTPSGGWTTGDTPEKISALGARLEAWLASQWRDVAARRELGWGPGRDLGDLRYVASYFEPFARKVFAGDLGDAVTFRVSRDFPSLSDPKKKEPNAAARHAAAIGHLIRDLSGDALDLAKARSGEVRSHINAAVQNGVTGLPGIAADDDLRVVVCRSQSPRRPTYQFAMIDAYPLLGYAGAATVMGQLLATSTGELQMKGGTDFVVRHMSVAGAIDALLADDDDANGVDCVFGLSHCPGRLERALLPPSKEVFFGAFTHLLPIVALTTTATAMVLESEHDLFRAPREIYVAKSEAGDELVRQLFALRPQQGDGPAYFGGHQLPLVNNRNEDLKGVCGMINSGEAGADRRAAIIDGFGAITYLEQLDGVTKALKIQGNFGRYPLGLAFRLRSNKDASIPTRLMRQVLEVRNRPTFLGWEDGLLGKYSQYVTRIAREPLTPPPEKSCADPKR